MKKLKKRAMKVLIYIFSVLVFIYVAHGVAILLFQSKLVYQPYKELKRSPQDIGIPYEEVSFKSQYNLKLSAWFIPAKKPKATILFCHGNAGNLSTRLSLIKILHSLGLSVFIFDYQGYGKSQGKPSEEGTYSDAEFAWKYLTQTKKIPDKGIIIYGRSLGGPIAARLASRKDPKGLIIDSSFISISHIAKELFPIFPIKYFLLYNYPTERYIQKVRAPILIIHSTDDYVIAYENGQKLFHKANEPKTFLKIMGSHSDGFFVSGSVYTEGLLSYISQLPK